MVRSITCALTIFARCLQILFALVALSCLAALLGINPGGPALVNYSLWVTIINILEGGLGILFCVLAVPKRNAAQNSNNALKLHDRKSRLCYSVELGCVVGFFTLCAAIAFAAILPAKTCYEQVSRDQNSVALGSMTRCTTGQAATAFLWFNAAFLGLAIFGSYVSVKHLDNQTISPREVVEIVFHKQQDCAQPSNDTTDGAAQDTRAQAPMTSHAAPIAPIASAVRTHDPDNPPSYSEVASIDDRVADREPASSREEEHGVPWRGFSSLFAHRKDTGDAAEETA